MMDRCSHTNRGINHDGTYRQTVEVDRIDAAVLAEELAEIYSTPTPKGWPEPKKVNNWYLIDCVFDYNSQGFTFIPWADKSPK